MNTMSGGQTLRSLDQQAHSGYSGIANQGPANPEAPHGAAMADAMRRLQGATDRLEQVVNAMDGRLQAVMVQNQPPGGAGDEKETELYASPLAEEIRKQARRVSNFTQALVALLQRIDL